MSVGAVNKQTGERIPTAGMPAVDSVLSGSSTNPVQNRVVAAALDEKADTDIVASDFDATASYTAGDYCIYEGKFYRFKNNHSGAWSAADVDEIKIAGELASIKSGLINGEVDTTSVQDVRFVKIGRVVTMATEVWHQGFTVPSGYRPWAVTHIPVRVSAGGGTSATIGYIRVGTDGALTIPDYTDFVGSVTWVTA